MTTNRTSGQLPATFQEFGRVKVSDNTDIVASYVIRSGEIVGMIVNQWIRTTKRPEGFFTDKAIFIPGDKIAEFIGMFGELK